MKSFAILTLTDDVDTLPVCVVFIVPVVPFPALVLPDIHRPTVSVFPYMHQPVATLFPLVHYSIVFFCPDTLFFAVSLLAITRLGLAACLRDPDGLTRSANRVRVRK